MRKSLTGVYMVIVAIIFAMALLFGCDRFKTVVDTKTGVTYLVRESPSGEGGGITPLLERDGKPVISEDVSR